MQMCLSVNIIELGGDNNAWLWTVPIIRGSSDVRQYIADTPHCLQLTLQETVYMYKCYCLHYYNTVFYACLHVVHCHNAARQIMTKTYFSLQIHVPLFAC